MKFRDRAHFEEELAKSIVKAEVIKFDEQGQWEIEKMEDSFKTEDIHWDNA